MRRASAKKQIAKSPSHTPISVRLPAALRQTVQTLARQRGESGNAALNRLIDEGVRMAKCPGVLFTDGPSGRRASIAGSGVDVWEVVRTLRSCQGDEAAMRALYPQLSHAQITAALRYAKTYADGIAERIALADAVESEGMESVPTLKVS
jgi:uncharacterized protein (DUF433 family)